VNVWLSLPFLTADGLRTLTQLAERSGITGLSLSDHVCVPVDIAGPYPYGTAKPLDFPPDSELPDPLVAAAALAATTTRVRFMTGVVILPLRHPIHLAKQAATVAAMSGGRFDLGVGVGWLREEFVALGRDDFDRRGSVADEMLSLLPQLWTGRPVAHAGDHFAFDAVAVNPVPPAPVPLFVGGTSNAALRRCATFADGWVGANHTVEELASIVERLAEARAKAGTADRRFEVRTGLRGTVTHERVAALRAMGVDSFVLAPWQIGPRRDSVYDVRVDAIAEHLPPLLELIRQA
jgi:probable F420-dependent oxidoreductase